MPRALTPEQKREKIDSIKANKGVTEVTTETGRAIRRKRGALNGSTPKMAIGNLIEGYHLHWMNDEKNRIEAALDNGYEFVSPEEIGGMRYNNVTNRNTELSENRVRLLVGTTQDGPLFAYLMKIPQEWYEEDQQELQDRNNLVDEAIRGGRSSGVDSTGFYVPKSGGISYKT